MDGGSWTLLYHDELLEQRVQTLNHTAFNQLVLPVIRVDSLDHELGDVQIQDKRLKEETDYIRAENRRCNTGRVKEAWTYGRVVDEVGRAEVLFMIEIGCH